MGTQSVDVDSTLTLWGDFVEVDDSFDHEHGVKRQSSTEIKDFSITVLVGGHELDLTDYIRQTDFELYEKLKVDFVSGLVY
jgi:hypothetical protein